MNSTVSFLSYKQTGYFSKIVLDYLGQDELIRPFYLHPVSLEGVKASIENRQSFNTDREALASVLEKQYAALQTNETVLENINKLRSENTFTVCTAHQPNIFTGPLYFVYKILQAIKLARQLKLQLPQFDFVPVYYMGSEDADIEELGHIFIDGKKYEWSTAQTGAVGRMRVDKNLAALLDEIKKNVPVYPHGEEIIALIQAAYKEGDSIEQATFSLVDRLFGAYGLVTLLPDNADLKRLFSPVIQKELLEEFSHRQVQETISRFPSDYKAQASGRELNMFYLKDDRRDRIELKDGLYSVVNTELRFTKEELLQELKNHPERFSPNVILRPVFQEFILPNIAFIGGGGEIAYWLQLKKVFEAASVPYPVLILRNSFVFINQEVQEKIDKLKLAVPDLFQKELDIINQIVKREADMQLSLGEEIEKLQKFYEGLSAIAGKVDSTLGNHTAALQTQAVKKLAALEKKMLRAERRKFDTEQERLQKIRRRLFPNNSLQERVDNLIPYYVEWGRDFIETVLKHSEGLQQQFGIITQQQ